MPKDAHFAVMQSMQHDAQVVSFIRKLDNMTAIHRLACISLAKGKQVLEYLRVRRQDAPEHFELDALGLEHYIAIIEPGI